MKTRLRGIATALLLSLPAAALLVASPAVAATAAAMEGERMTLLSGRTWAVTDAAASAGRAISVRTNGTLSGALTSSAATQRLVLRLRGDQYLGAPQAVVRVDGVKVGALAVSAKTWTNYTLSGSWSAARHTVQVSFINDLGRATGDRNLLVDRVALESVATSPAAAPAAINDTYETRIVQLVNQERAKAGLKPLAVSSCVDGYAEQWSARMASTGSFAHRTDLLGPMRACGGHSIGENIAYGNITADQMMQNWMNSPGHRANILDADFTHIGVAAVTTSTGRVYGTQNFLTV